MKNVINKQLDLLNSIELKSWQERLVEVNKMITSGAVFSTSFSIEDQAITHAIAELKLNIEIFTLDTGRLFDETYKVWQETVDKYKIDIKPYYPDHKKLDDFVNNKGPNAIYQSKEIRLRCCDIRKVIPLNSALKEKNLWISGIRKSHSQGRSDKSEFEIDEERGLIKYYPIIDLNDDELWDFIKKNNIPYNDLYDKGFTSIGCAPCSRVPTDKNDPRSGRWWWEADDSKECGLHMVNGKLVRIKKDD